MKRCHAKTAVMAIGVVLAAFGLFVGYQVATTEEQWGTANLVATFGPLGLGLTIAFPQVAERVLETLAPYMAFIEDPEEES